MVPRPRGAAILKDSRETALCEMRQRQVLRYVGEAEASYRSIEHFENAVEDELAL